MLGFLGKRWHAITSSLLKARYPPQKICHRAEEKWGMGFKAIIIIRKQFLRQTQCIQLRLKCLHLSSWFFSSSQKLYKNRYHYHYLTDRSRSQWGDQPVLAASGSGHMAQPGLWLFRTRYCLCGECGSKDRTLGSSPFFSFYPIPRASPQGEESLFKIGFIRGSLGRHRST